MGEPMAAFLRELPLRGQRMLGKSPQARERDVIEKLDGYNYIYDAYVFILTP